MNKVFLMGRMVRKEELKSVGKKGNEHIISNFSIAVDKLVNGEKQANFFNITAWDKKADFIEKYVEIGKRILIEGSLDINKYTDKDGKNHNVTTIIANSIEFADKFDKKENNSQENSDELPF